MAARTGRRWRSPARRGRTVHHALIRPAVGGDQGTFVVLVGLPRRSRVMPLQATSRSPLSSAGCETMTDPNSLGALTLVKILADLPTPEADLDRLAESWRELARTVLDTPTGITRAARLKAALAERQDAAEVTAAIFAAGRLASQPARTQSRDRLTSTLTPRHGSRRSRSTTASSRSSRLEPCRAGCATSSSPKPLPPRLPRPGGRLGLVVLATACARWLGVADANRAAGDDDKLIEPVAIVAEDVIEPFDPKR